MFFLDSTKREHIHVEPPHMAGQIRIPINAFTNLVSRNVVSSITGMQSASPDFKAMTSFWFSYDCGVMRIHLGSASVQRSFPGSLRQRSRFWSTKKHPRDGTSGLFFR